MRKSIFVLVVGLIALTAPWGVAVATGVRAPAGPQRPLAIPGNRCCMAFAYDSVDNLYIMFGGTSNGTSDWDDTWTGRLVNSTFTWQQPTVVCAPVSTVCPAARHSTRMTYDAADNIVIMYGGAPNLGDTWVGKISNSGTTLTWTRQCATGSCPPGSRSSPGLAWDPAIPGAVMYGGTNGSGGQLNDTWVGTWSSSLSSFTWESTARCSGTSLPKVPSAACGPGARASAALTWDSDTSQLTLFGGEGNAPSICGGSTGQKVCGDTWVFNGTTWDNKTESSPPSNLARSGHRIVYDDVHHRLVMFGGFTDPADPGTDNNDTFIGQWTSGTGKYTWTQASPSTSPSARCCVGLGFQSGTNNGVILFGGGDVNHVELQDTWGGRLGSGVFTWDCLLACPTG